MMLRMITGQTVPWPCLVYPQTFPRSVFAVAPLLQQRWEGRLLSQHSLWMDKKPWGKQGAGDSEVLPHWRDCISYRFTHWFPSACCWYVVSSGLWLQLWKGGGSFGLCSQLKICPGFCPGLQRTYWRLSWLNVGDGRSVQMHSLEYVFSAKGGSDAHMGQEILNSHALR